MREGAKNRQIQDFYPGKAQGVQAIIIASIRPGGACMMPYDRDNWGDFGKLMEDDEDDDDDPDDDLWGIEEEK